MKQRVTGVFNSSYKQVFALARIINVFVREDSEVMRHPVEKGAKTVDHRIIELIPVNLEIIVETANVQNIYKEIRQNFTNATLLTIQTLTNAYKNQFISGLPHEENAQLRGAIVMHLSLVEFREVQTQSQPILSPVNQNDTPTVNRGTQLPLSVNQIQTLEGRINAF